MPDLVAVICPQCGEEHALDWRKFMRNVNLTLTCSQCDLVYLAFNAVAMVAYQRMKELGRPVGPPPVPSHIDPVRILPGENGFEVVFRRYNNGKERVYTRRARKPRPAK